MPALLRSILVLLFALALSACQHTPMTHTSDQAFPGAIGFGTGTPGGRGGQIIKVTTLAASGPGSLRAALDVTGPRIVVFEVGGIIDLDRNDLVVREPFVTIAGQTAPSPGITLIRAGMKIRTHDVVMQHLRIRMGDAGLAKKSGYESDVSIEGKNAWNVVVDHCSVSWGTDENLSVSGERYDGPLGTARLVTLSNNIIAEGLVDSTHEKGKHSMGSLIHDSVTEVAVIGNLYAHNNDRNPWFKGGTTGMIINNFVYNPGTWAIRLGYNPKEWEGRAAPPAPMLAIIGNVMQHGANTPTGKGFIGSNAPDRQGDAWMDDNLAFTTSGAAAPLAFGGVRSLSAPPAWAIGIAVQPANTIREHVLNRAGARPADRDSVDLRLIADIRAGKGHHIDSQNDAGGYPQAAPSHRSLTPPKDRIDAWLASFSASVEGR
ncbi:hypothetical protein Q9Q94_16750 [Uliginosibacterium sp. 31-16]|uniref:pectate lyase family protein n=1 Tax=Uliginosibacterium sp. 31-16 TaxID=3068315 RepID=UPI00273DFDB0|nr:hypothetical protein [Uliginosibacterium sp. 31-16]MDP5241191.1 hypothetical protein [Uliginosibacterium sp. 31-16]